VGEFLKGMMRSVACIRQSYDKLKHSEAFESTGCASRQRNRSVDVFLNREINFTRHLSVENIDTKH